MLTELKSSAKVVGVKQTQRAVVDGRARTVFLAQDADPRIIASLSNLCREKGVPTLEVPGMKELGAACGIAVGSAAAALLV